MTKDGAGTKARSRVGPAGRAAALVAVATVAALVPAVAASGQSRPGPGLAGAAPVAGGISTVAGGKAPGPAPATSVALTPCGVSFAAGSLYVGASQTVRQVSQDGTLTTPAGTGSSGPLGDGGLATRASLGRACSTAVDAAGNLLIADAGNGRVRVAAATTGTFYGQAMHQGDIYSIPDTGGGAIALDAAGNVLMAGGSLVQVLAVTTGTFYGQKMTTGNAYTVAGGGHNGLGDGGPATFAEVSPDGVAVDAAGNLVIADSGNGRIRVVAVKTGTFYGQTMTAGNIYTVAGNGAISYSGDGGPATSAQLNDPVWVAVDGAGNQVIADLSNYRVRVAAAKTGTFYGQAMTAGNIYTVAGTGKRDSGAPAFVRSGIPATKALITPDGVALDRAGNLVISEPRGLRVVPVKTGTWYGLAMKAGDIYTVAGNGGVGFSGDGGPATAAEFFDPRAVVADAAGNLVIADSGNGRLRVLAARTGMFYGVPMTAGDIYTVAGAGSSLGDGGPAITAGLSEPAGVALDAAGNVLIADPGHFRVRVIAVTTGTFYGRAMTANDIYTVAGGGTSNPGDGGPATAAELFAPLGVAVDGHGNLVIADVGDAVDNPRVRVVAAATGTFYAQAMTAGDIYTVAGGNPGGFSGDGGPATSAQLSSPAAVAEDGANLLIADSGNNRIREVAG